MNNYNIIININILTFDKVLNLFTKSIELNNSLTLDENIYKYLESISINNYYIDQIKTYKENNNIIINYIILTNDYKNKDEANINKLENSDIKSYLKKNLDSIITYLFKDTFTLPELLNIYEVIYDKKYDRRNFRKKLLKSNKLEEVSIEVSKNIGRPAKVYKFKGVDYDE